MNFLKNDAIQLTEVTWLNDIPTGDTSNTNTSTKFFENWKSI